MALSYEGLSWFTGAAVMAGALPDTPILIILALYSAGAHGIMTLNDFKAVEGDRATGLRSLPVFVFHEGHEPVAERAFREIARLSGGAYCRFDASSAQQLRDLLSAVAVFAAGGRRALEDFGRRKRGVALQLTHEISKRAR